MYRPLDLGEVISAKYVFADSAAVEHPKPVSHRPPRIIGNDFELAEMIAPILKYQPDVTDNMSRSLASIKCFHRPSNIFCLSSRAR
jgi:hypothetical protein